MPPTGSDPRLPADPASRRRAVCYTALLTLLLVLLPAPAALAHPAPPAEHRSSHAQHSRPAANHHAPAHSSRAQQARPSPRSARGSDDRRSARRTPTRSGEDRLAPSRSGPRPEARPGRPQPSRPTTTPARPQPARPPAAAPPGQARKRAAQAPPAALPPPAQPPAQPPRTGPRLGPALPGAVGPAPSFVGPRAQPPPAPGSPLGATRGSSILAPAPLLGDPALLGAPSLVPELAGARPVALPRAAASPPSGLRSGLERIRDAAGEVVSLPSLPLSAPPLYILLVLMLLTLASWAFLHRVEVARRERERSWMGDLR